ncbi:MAG TPA: GNAT family N-acetyltransferase [Baekduia sp.]|uniref:GNAT family N-acetyltransferase n=1 Tax=Baekduia sp. TaxID=2600305 RepID=UPI002CACD103|nr:GNAT family N-acetyltransferase [Baekduia sp.]HMJ33323.1 GNAT family N-acetyltransferase [Baekduia sp.]
MTADLQRAFAFERVMHSAVGRTVTAAWGQAFLDPTLPRCHERNFVWAGGDAGATVLDAAAERLLGGAALLHRRITVEEPHDAQLRAGLRALGYDGSHHVFLAFAPDAPPPAPVAGVEVVEVGADAVVPANDHYLRTDPDTDYGRDDVTRSELLEHHRAYAAAGPADERIFAVVVAGAVVAWARLWSAGGVAQVEDVVCLAEHRGRGYGRAVVAAATRAALAGRPELTFIVADADDWPKELYGRLGYAPIGHLGVYLRLVAPRG